MRRDTSDCEDGRPIDCDTGDADPLLENLEPDDELDAATGVELARAPAEKHGQVAILARGLPLQLDNVADILKFSFRRTVTFTAETAKYESGFFLTPDFDEPSRGLGHSPYDEEEEDEGYDLESNGEAPDEGGYFLPVERGAVFNPVSDDDTENVESEFDRDELTARCVAGGFGGPDRGDGIKNAGPDTVEGPGAEHPFSVLGGALESGTNDGP